MVWDKGAFDASNMPANNSNLRLYEAKQRNDVLVVYNEYSERKKTVRPRAYLVNENEDRIAHEKAPQFVSLGTNWIRKLSAVPVYPCVSNAVPAVDLYAVYATNHQSFTLYSSNRALNSYNLPFYDDGVGRKERIMITPLTVAADMVIVAGVVAILAAASQADCGCDPLCQ